MYPRPKLTHNQLALLYFSGEEPKESSQEEGIAPCPFLSEENLCKIYERRPVICRILNSLERCGQESSAVLSEELYLMGLIALQIVENIDIGGLYGNLFDFLKFFQEQKEGRIEEVPSYLLSTVEFEELPLLPEEKTLRSWVGNLYRKKVMGDKTFRDLLDSVKEQINAQKRLSFLSDIFGE
ncbi:MAG: YkgJ family cysteine cluster protein [Caldimicrobium sp.]